MSSSTTSPTRPRAPRRSPRGGAPRTGVWAWISRNLVLIFGFLVLLYMFVPILVVIAMTFNEPGGTGRSISYSFDSFTLDNWRDPCEPIGMCAAVAKSVEIGFLSTIVATLLGTLMAFAMVRHRFRGHATANVLIFLPMATPDVVMGISLVTLFVNAGMGSVLGFWTVFIAHVMFCLSFVLVTVKARLTGMDPRLEQAAADLYANEWQTFWRVSLPLVFPGILAAALLSFSLSFDDFIITDFTSGTLQTFPLFVWGSARREIPPEINVVGTVMFLVALAVVVFGEFLGRRRERGVA